jgi:hypothetical protein
MDVPAVEYKELSIKEQGKTSIKPGKSRRNTLKSLKILHLKDKGS